MKHLEWALQCASCYCSIISERVGWSGPTPNSTHPSEISSPVPVSSPGSSTACSISTRLFTHSSPDRCIHLSVFLDHYCLPACLPVCLLASPSTHYCLLLPASPRSFLAIKLASPKTTLVYVCVCVHHTIPNTLFSHRFLCNSAPSPFLGLAHACRLKYSFH